MTVIIMMIILMMILFYLNNIFFKFFIFINIKMPAKKATKKSKKGGTALNADLTSIAVPFGLLLAKQSLEKLSDSKVSTKKASLNKTNKKKLRRVKRVTAGGSNVNAVANATNAVAKANAAVNANAAANVPSGLNTMAHKTGANVGGNPKRSRGRPRSKVGGSNANVAANASANVAANASANVAANVAVNAVANVPSGVNTMAHKTGANVGGKPNRRSRAKVGGTIDEECKEEAEQVYEACVEEKQQSIEQGQQPNNENFTGGKYNKSAPKKNYASKKKPASKKKAPKKKAPKKN
jgi:hypothetical protein